VAWYLASSESYGKKDYCLRFVNYCYIPAAFFSILLTGSRGGLIATLPGILFILWSFGRLKLLPKILVFMLLTSSLFALQSFVPQSSFDRLSTTGASISAGDLNGRGYIWKEGIEVFSEHPLSGVGSRGFRHAIESGRAPHNTYLSVLVDLGIVGFVLFAIILAIVAYRAIHQPKWESRFWLTVLMTLATGAMVHNAEGEKIVWLFLTLVVVAANLPVQNVESRRRSKFPVKAIGLPKG
jgi:O-antigen ligase